MVSMKKGRYEIRGKLGEGGMGVVFRAWDPPPVGREVAFKTLPAFPDHLALELFYKECSILKSMSHPNVVEIFDMGEFEEEGRRKPFFVMPLLPGQTLEEIIRTSSHRLTVARVVEIMSQTCRGLQAAHDRGLIHRDLKPSNIFVMADDSVKIIDFGVAHAVDVRSRSAGFSKGTLLYMAPEQIEHKPVSPQSDIFSLGVVCYEALTRRQPFRGATEEEVVEAIRTSIPPPASDINPAVGQTISRVVHKAMAKQPWNRYDSVRELGETLQKALRNEPIELFDPARIQPRLQRASKALESGDYQFADEIVAELEAEGNIDPQLTLLRSQIDQVTRQKTVAQLLESARARYEEDEDPLALQKLQEVLKLDPSHAAALGLKAKIDQRRSEKQIEQWVRLARQHIDHHAYSPARDALQNVFALKPNDTRALRLLKEVEAEEQDYLRLRREKTDKYQAALNAWKNGEVSEALSQMKVVLDLDRRAPDSSSPETGATYQVFYNKVRSEHDAINTGYAEARRQLAEHEFAKAREICQTFLAKYPGHALFQALKFDVEEQQRQQLSAFIADVDRRLDAEPDLDAKVSLLREAVALYPDEQHFRRPLKLVEDKRDLVNSIVARAQVHEERGQISEALNDLEILQTIYSPYPGLKFERERLEKRLEQQARQTAKAGWVSQIDRHLEAANHTRALELLDSADAEFPDDPELVELRKLATQGLARSLQAEQLFVEGQDLCARGELDRGIETLSMALELDDRSPIRAALCEVLVRQAQDVLDRDWRAAESLADRVLALEPAHALARSIRAHALDSKREAFVAQCTMQARRLQASGDLSEGLAEVEKGLVLYPAEPRLTSLLETLRKDYNVRSRSRAFSDVEHARTLAPSTEAVTKGRPESVSVDVPPVAQPTPQEGMTVVRPVPVQVVTPPPVVPRPVTAPAVAVRKVVEGVRLVDRRALMVIAAVVLIAVITTLLSLARRSDEAPPPATAAATLPIHIVSSPPGATIRVNNEVRGTSDVRMELHSGTYQVEASLPGYTTATSTLSVGPGMSPDVTLTLTPLLGTLRIATSDPESSDVFLDDNPAGKIEGGSFTLNDISAGAHVLRISGQQPTIPDASIAFAAQPGAVPDVTTLTTPERQAVVISTMPGGARITSTLGAVDVAIDGTPYGRLTNKGVEIPALAEGFHELTLGSGREPRKVNFTVGNAPAMDIILFSDRNVGSVFLQADQDDASVIVDGQPYPGRTQGGVLRIPNLAAGKHTVRVVKEGFRPPETQTISITKGQEATVKFALVAVERFATLVVERTTPGVQVSLDDAVIGKVGPDGRFSYTTVAPGRHTVALTLAGHEPSRNPRDFVAGETVSISNPTLAVSEGSLEILADSRTSVEISRGTQVLHRFTGTRTVSLTAGMYGVSAQGPAKVPRDTSVTVAAGGKSSVDLRNIVTGLELFDAPDRWEKDDNWASRKGGGFVMYNKTRPIGRFEFTLRQSRGWLPFSNGKRVKWVVGYTDPSNYVLLQMDEKYFYRNEVIDGKNQQVQRREHYLKDKAPFIHVSIDVRDDQMVHQISEDGSLWKEIDTFRRATDRSIANGRFGFSLQGDDEIAISNFRFTPEGLASKR